MVYGNTDIQKMEAIRANKLFCKIYGIPINIYDEPYFSSRLRLFEKSYGAQTKYGEYIKDMALFDTPEEYHVFCNNIKDAMVKFIHSTGGYKRLVKCNMSKYNIVNENIPKGGLYEYRNDGKYFLRISLADVGFTELRWYDSSMFGVYKDYSSLVRENTGGINSISNSDYIKQLIFNECSPKRLSKLGYYIINNLLNKLVLKYFNLSDIVRLSSTELVISIGNSMKVTQYESLMWDIGIYSKEEIIELKVDLFKLVRIPNTNYYYERYSQGKTKYTRTKLVDIDILDIPFIIRAIGKEDITDNDKINMVGGRKIKLLEIKEIII